MFGSTGIDLLTMKYSYIAMKYSVVCALLLSDIVISLPTESINYDLTIKNVDRSIDLSSQLAKIIHKITIENNGKTPVKNFLFAIEPQFKSKVAFVGAQTGTNLKVTEVKVDSHVDKQFYRIDLKEALSSGKTVTVEVETVYTYILTPYPTSISQKDKQFVRYRGNHYIYSPYQVIKQTTAVNVGTRNVESYSKLLPLSQSDTTYTYGPYTQIQPFSEDVMVIHYENNSPFLSVTHLQRVIEVSHWGNIAVEEEIDLLHTGAKLKGPFSRYEYQREAHSGVSSIKSFKTILPAAATDAYYRDEIGNISTSHMRVLSDSVELDLRPRFPLFGGWKTHYVLGYSVPSYEYLYNSGDDYKLKMRLVDHVFDDMVIDEAVTKIILPEGSHSMQLTTPYPVQRLPDSLHYTYLDTKGRIVISVTMKNLVEHHIQDFELSYVFPRILMLQEPLLVVIAFYLLFLLVVIYVRLDFCIAKDEASESRLRVSGLCDKILVHQDKRADTYSSFDSALAKLKQNKDVNTFLTVIKNINQEYKTETTHIAELLVKLKADAPEIAEKVSELQKLDKHLKDLYVQQQSLYVDKLVPGKISRGPFVDAENNLNKKKEDYEEKINNIVKSLH
ncbi:dolichyl-diphosphooligosaccharide--protein glycosyltransferase subunit 1 [Lycorma delicatula]|uniref:dolichyl-diphosphooligosaccharide--protein glycosyltransferase subunit 1 n=1 Tax=Lycorma delicatula TaxID=130591 RepID=UPI003F50DA05